jgi:hypothetical protein
MSHSNVWKNAQLAPLVARARRCRLEPEALGYGRRNLVDILLPVALVFQRLRACLFLDNRYGGSGTARRCWACPATRLIVPEPPEPSRREFGVADRVLDVLKRGTCEQWIKEGKGFGQVDAAVVPNVPRQCGAAPASCARL